MELRHLRYFVAVARELHFGHAAARLHTAQSSLSQQIRNLERELGVELFLRTKHRVELTEPGRRFFDEAQRILAAAERAGHLARRAGRTDRLVLGISPEANWQILRGVFRRLAERGVSIDTVFHNLPTEAQIEGLRDGWIDVGFLTLPVAEEALVTEVIERVRFLVALPEKHPMAGHRRLALEGLAGESYALWPRHLSPVLYDRMEGIYRRAGFGPPLKLEGGFPSVRTTLGMVAAGLTVALADPATRRMSFGGVVFRELKSPPSFERGVAYRREDRSEILGVFLESVRAEARVPPGRAAEPRAVRVGSA